MISDGPLLFGRWRLWTASATTFPCSSSSQQRSYDKRNRIRQFTAAVQPGSRDLGRMSVPRQPAGERRPGRSFGIDGPAHSTPAELRKALKRGTAAMREGRPYLIDAMIMQLDRRGVRTEQTWYPARRA
jgi:hypothetical protein